MFALETIKSMNRAGAVCKQRRLARALNNPGGHAKDGEKGRSAKKAHCAKKAQGSCAWCGQACNHPDGICGTCMRG